MRAFLREFTTVKKYKILKIEVQTCKLNGGKHFCTMAEETCLGEHKLLSLKFSVKKMNLTI